jgi:uncharacterized protein
VRESPSSTQADELVAIVRTNPFVDEVLGRAESLALPDWYLTAGCLFQTVWNHLHDYEPTNAIVDYDLFYFDASDVSWDAEDAVIRASAATLSGLGVDVQVRNQARVHLWFEDHFGIAIAPFVETEDAISNFLAPCCAVGMRTWRSDVEVCAPFGLDDLFDLVVRPNPKAAGPRSAYVAKTERWTSRWPKLTIFPWPELPRFEPPR